MGAYVLVHGSWHGGWCWERVKPLLEAQGCRVIAPDLPGMGADQTPLASVTLESWAHFVADLISREAEPVVLVGHSRGGIVISQIAEYVPDRIARLIYLTAFVPQDGQSVMALAQLSPTPSDLTPDKVVFAEDGVSCTVAPSAVAPVFYNTTPAEWVARAESLLTPEPVAALMNPVHVTPQNFGRVPKSYIECTGDRAIDISLQRLMQTHWPFEKVLTMNGDHSPFFAKPEEVAAALIALA